MNGLCAIRDPNGALTRCMRRKHHKGDHIARGYPGHHAELGRWPRRLGEDAAPSTEDRFWAKVDKSLADGCWVWTASVGPAGYGHFHLRSFGRRNAKVSIPAHRYSWEFANGPIPDGQSVLHRCDNRPCVNPAHLFLGTDLDNARDRQEKGRSARGDRNGKSRLTEAKVIELRRLARVTAIDEKALAARFGVHPRTIYNAVHGISWAHV